MQLPPDLPGPGRPPEAPEVADVQQRPRREAVACRAGRPAVVAARARGVRRMPTVREAAEEWLEALTEGRTVNRSGKPSRASTVRGYQRELQASVLPALGDRRLDAVTRGDVLALIGRLQTAGLSPSTVRNVLLPLRVLYRYAGDHDWVTVNPTAGVAMPAVSESRRERFATAEEARLLVAALEDRDRPLWGSAFYAGLRRGELMALRWSDVDLVGRVLHVRPGLRPGGEGHDRAQDRGRASHRPDPRRAARPPGGAPGQVSRR